MFTDASTTSHKHQSINLLIDNDRYLARPIGIDLPMPYSAHERNGKFVTYLQAQKGQHLSADSLHHWRTEVLNRDDVFRESFLQTIVVGGVKRDELRIDDDVQALLAQWDTKEVCYAPDVEADNGPYYVYANRLYSIWKLYDDQQLAFVQTIWPAVDDEATFVKIDAATDDFRGLPVAVPARSYSAVTKEFLAPQFHAQFKDLSSNALDASRYLASTQPMKGLRIAVKDNFAIRGLKTTLCNRAFCQLQSVKSETATVVSRLIDAGAHIVGKTYMSAFAMMEHPTQSVDYQASFNPRGDGYLITGGSSGGSAAAVASYPWLDIAICTDTTGSARIPAFQTGVFGLRPSTFSIPSKGMEKAWLAVDTPAWFARSLALFPTMLSVLSRNEEDISLRERKNTTRLLYLTDFIPASDPEQASLLNEYLNDLSRASGAEVIRASLEDDWRASTPTEEKDLHKYLYHTMDHGWYYSAYHSFSAFREAYQENFGHEPFVTEVIRWYWSLGEKVTSEQHEEILRRFDVFRRWFLSQYMADEGVRTLCAIHVDRAQPKYRDKYPGNDNPFVPGLRPTYLAPVLQAPELAIPISEISFYSRITERKERLPFVIGLMGAPNSDIDLVQWTLETMQRAERATVVDTGDVIWKA